MKCYKTKSREKRLIIPENMGKECPCHISKNKDLNGTGFNNNSELQTQTEILFT